VSVARSVGDHGLPGHLRRGRRTTPGPVLGPGAELREGDENGEYWIVLHDIEGNEFCVQ
jgi:hypothetical protein